MVPFRQESKPHAARFAIIIRNSIYENLYLVVNFVVNFVASPAERIVNLVVFSCVCPSIKLTIKFGGSLFYPSGKLRRLFFSPPTKLTTRRRGALPRQAKLATKVGRRVTSGSSKTCLLTLRSKNRSRNLNHPLLQIPRMFRHCAIGPAHFDGGRQIFRPIAKEGERL